MSRHSSDRLRVACLLIVVALVLATRALDNLQGRRFKRAIGRNATPWNVTGDYIPPWIMLLSREPIVQLLNEYAELGVPEEFPQVIKDNPNDLIRYAYDGYFLGFGIIYGQSKTEQYVIANVGAMIRATKKHIDGTTQLRGYNFIHKMPIMGPLDTQWHEAKDSYIVRHLLTFGTTGFALYAIRKPSPVIRARSSIKKAITNVPPSLRRDRPKRDSEYKNCWAYSMMHGYYENEGANGKKFYGNTIKRFWGRWPVKLIECNKGSICTFEFDRWLWVNEPEYVGVEDMPEEMKAQALPCGWQDIGAPIFCARQQEDEHTYDAIEKMKLSYLIVMGEVPEPKNLSEIRGRFARDCYLSRSYSGNFTAFSLEKTLEFMYRYVKDLEKQ